MKVIAIRTDFNNKEIFSDIEKARKTFHVSEERLIDAINNGNELKGYYFDILELDEEKYFL